MSRMELAPIARTPISDVVYSRLVDEILSGRLAPGQSMPSERELALAFQVNRHAIREALKRVRQAGLIQISHGGKTLVLNWRENAGLEVLSALVAAGAVPPREVMRDVAVMRRSTGADAARLCALNASDEHLDRVATAARAYPVNGTGAEIGDADHAFWIAVIEGSGNLAYRLALNTLVTAFVDIGLPLIQDLGAAEFTDRDAHIALADAIVARDGERARQHAEQLLSHFVSAFTHELPEE